MVQHGEGHTPSGFQGLTQGEGGKDSKLRDRLVFKEQPKHRHVKRQQGGQAGCLQDLRDISEREGSQEAGLRAK